MSGEIPKTHVAIIVFIEQTSIGTLPALNAASPIGGDQQGDLIMSMSFVPARQAAASFAGAFIVAMLFVSAAVGPLTFA